MTTIEDAREEAVQMFHTGWASRTPYLIENNVWPDRETADGDGPGSVPDGPWARINVVHIGAPRGKTTARRHIGASPVTYTRRAQVQVQIFDLPGAGSRRSGQLAQAVLDIFESAKQNGLTFEAGEVQEAGLVDEQQLTVVTVPFEYDQRK